MKETVGDGKLIIYIYIFISPNHGSSIARNNIYIQANKKKKELNYIIQFIYKQKRRRKKT